MVKKIITDISEEDFRKLNLVAKENRLEKCPGGGSRYAFVEVSLNSVLDKQIESMIEDGYEEDQRYLQIPVTIAIHEDDGYYLDKFMNRFTGARTFQVGVGIKHLYSTRDYYEDHEDYWRVSKRETKQIYRIFLDPKHLERFVLKHKTEEVDWPYDIPSGIDPKSVGKLIIYYDLIDGKFVETSRSACFRLGHCSTIYGVDKNGIKIPPAWEKEGKHESGESN